LVVPAHTPKKGGSMWGHSSRSVRIALGALLLTGVALVLGATSARSDVPGTSPFTT
jgi:hypothetical protein